MLTKFLHSVLVYANPFLMIPLHFFVLWSLAEKRHADLYCAWQYKSV